MRQKEKGNSRIQNENTAINLSQLQIAIYIYFLGIFLAMVAWMIEILAFKKIYV